VIKLAPVLTSIIALGIALSFGVQQLDINNHLVSSAKTYFESCKLFYNETVNGYIATGGLFSGRHLFEQYEKRVLEYHGPSFVISVISALTK
jgi:hypothetical protein